MRISMKSSHRPCKPALAAALVFAVAGAASQTSLTVKEDAAQLSADQAALQRQVKRLDADEARLKSDSASGRMSAESKDAYAVYTGKHAIAGEKKDIAADKDASAQMQSDKAALQRQIKRLQVAETRLKSDTASGRMAAESKDAEKVYKDRQFGPAEKKAIAIDHSNMADEQKK